MSFLNSLESQARLLGYKYTIFFCKEAWKKLLWREAEVVSRDIHQMRYAEPDKSISNNRDLQPKDTALFAECCRLFTPTRTAACLAIHLSKGSYSQQWLGAHLALLFLQRVFSLPRWLHQSSDSAKQLLKALCKPQALGPVQKSSPQIGLVKCYGWWHREKWKPLCNPEGPQRPLQAWPQNTVEQSYCSPWERPGEKN